MDRLCRHKSFASNSSAKVASIKRRHHGSLQMTIAGTTGDSARLTAWLRDVAAGILRCLSDQFEKMSNHDRRIAATRCEIQGRPWLDRASKATVDDAVHV